MTDHCRPVVIWPHLNLTDHGHQSQTQQHAPGFLGWCGLGCSGSSKASGPPRTNMARSKIKPPRVLQRPCGKAIKWSYRGHNGDEIFNGLHRERGKYARSKELTNTSVCTQLLMHARVKTRTLVLSCKSSSGILQHKWRVKFEDIWGEFQLCDDLSHMNVFGKCVCALSLHFFHIFYFCTVWNLTKTHINTDGNEGSAWSAVSQRLVNQ